MSSTLWKSAGSGAWQKRGWIKSDKKPALNRDLWERLLPLVEKHEMVYHWIKGHAETEENNRCDELARGREQKIQTVGAAIPTAPVGAAIGRPQPTDSNPGTPPAPHPGLPLRGAGMAQSAMTERCYRSALWGSLRESQLPQHLTVALRAPPPLKGRLCARCADGSMRTSTPTICVLLP